VEPQVPDEGFEAVMRGSQLWFILRGDYIRASARSILINNKIGGTMVDITWDVLRQHIITVLRAVCHNFAIHLGFAFGVLEARDVDDQHSTGFTELSGIEISNDVVESDQGIALTALSPRHCQSQLFCLQHFLVLLKFKEFSLSVGNLVKYRSEAEFEMLKRVDEAEFRHLTKRSDLLRWTVTKAAVSIRRDQNVIEGE
jgi:hypothetical protein